MKNTVVKLKDGTEYSAPIWLFRPKEGFMTLIGIENIIYFKDVKSATTYNTWLSGGTIGDRDELERAKKEGWSS